MSQAKALWETKSQIAGLACQDTRYKGPVYQTARLNNNNQKTQKFIPSRGHPLVRQNILCGVFIALGGFSIELRMRRRAK
jgi:hypothetical protein